MRRPEPRRPALIVNIALIALALYGAKIAPQITTDYQVQQGIVWIALFLAARNALRLVQELWRRATTLVRTYRAFRGEDKDGTAWLTPKEARAAGLGKRSQHARFLGVLGAMCIWARTETAHLIIGPAGSQKSSAAIFNILCSNGTPTLVNDIKKELFYVTGPFRRRQFGHRVVLIDPTDPASECVNPLDLIASLLEADSPEALTMASEMVLQLYPEPPDPGSNFFFREGARQAIKKSTLAVCAAAPPKQRSLASVYRALTDESYLDEILNEAALSPRLNGELADLANDLHRQAFGDDGSAKTFEQFRLGAIQALEPFGRGGYLHRVTQRSTFSFEALKTGKVTVYLCVDPTKSKALGKFSGLMQWTATYQVVRARSNAPVVFALDEFCNAPLHALPEVLTLLRSYGVRVVMATQDLEDIDRVYGKYDRGRILSEASIKQFLAGIRSQTTLEYLSKHLGEIDDVRVGFSMDHDGPRESLNAERRPLLSADQIRRLNRDGQIILIDNLKPMLARKVQTFAIDPWRHQIGINTMYGSRRYLKPVEVGMFGPWWFDCHWVTHRGRTRSPIRRSTKRMGLYLLQSLIPSTLLVTVLVLALITWQIGMPYLRIHYTFSGSFSGSQAHGSCTYFSPTGDPLVLYEGHCPFIVFHKTW